MLRKLGAPLILLLAGTACRDTTGVAQRFINYAALGLHTVEQDGVVTTRPVATFSRGIPQTLPTTDTTDDACTTGGIATSPPIGTGNFISGGDSVLYSSQAASVYLKPATAGGVTTYMAPAAVAHTPGAVVTLTTPGAAGGFPAGTISSRSAEAFTLAPVPLTPAAGEQGLRVSWSPRTDGGSLIVLSLQYATPGTAAPNQQVLCTLIDDGTAIIASALVIDYRASDVRRNVATRWRAGSRFLDNDNAMIVLSSYETTAPNAP